MKAKVYSGITVLLMLIFFLGCKKEPVLPTQIKSKPGNTASSKINHPGGFVIRLTDSPGDYVALNVEIESVDIFREFGEFGGWVRLNEKAQKINILSLINGNSMIIANTHLDDGLYSKIRIKFGEDNSITTRGNSFIPGTDVNVVSTQHLNFIGNRNIIVEINKVVKSDELVEVLVDFDVAKSIITDREGLAVKPYITKVDNLTTGIEGDMDGATAALIIFDNGITQMSTYSNTAGKFKSIGLTPGDYNVKIIPSLVDEYGLPALNKPIVIESVVVKRGAVTDMGKIRL